MSAQPVPSSAPPAPDALAVVRDAEQLEAMVHPERRRLLHALSEPASAATLARRFGLPRQRVNYHLRELEERGLLSLVEERRKGNCIERVLVATARVYLVSPEALGVLAADEATARDRFSAAYLAAAAGRVVRDLGTLRPRAAAAGKSLATLTLEADIHFASPAERHAFAEELATALAQLTAKYDAGTRGRRHRVLLAAYPAITTEESSHVS